MNIRILKVQSHDAERLIWQVTKTGEQQYYLHIYDVVGFISRACQRTQCEVFEYLL